MSKVIYKDEPIEWTKIIESGKQVADFLPIPELLVRKESDKEKIIITLSRRSVDFYRDYAKKKGTKYQITE